MSNVTRCRVSMDDLGRRGKSGDKLKNFKALMGIFRKRVAEAGILTTFKEKQYFESKGEKRRRKKKEMDNNARKERLRSHFG